MKLLRSAPILTALCITGLLAPAGCSSAPATASEAAATPSPSDFTLEMTVLAPTARRGSRLAPRDRRPMRFVMETDWVLRSYTGRAGADADTFPNETRQLTTEQVAALWTDLAAAGLLDPAHPNIVGRALDLINVAPSEPTWVVAFCAHGDRRTIVLSSDNVKNAEPLLNRLADLAWMPK